MRDMTRIFVVPAAVALFVAGGCSGSLDASSTTSKATVSGTVKYQGKPARDGSLTFDPANINRKDAPMAKAEVGPDGSYKVETLDGGNTVRYIPKGALGSNDLVNMVDVKKGQTLDLEFTPSAVPKARRR